MTQQFPPKPWNVDDTFVNIETGVEYVFNGEQWIAGGSQYEAGYTERGDFEYRRSGDAFGSGVFQNIVDGGSRPHDSLTSIKLHKTSQDGNTAPSNYYQPGQLLRIKNGANAVFYRIATVNADNANFYLIDITYEGLQGNKFDFYLRDVLGIECRELAADPLDTYLPLSGGKITGDLEVSGVVKTLNVDSAQGSNLNLKCNGATRIYVGTDSTTVQGPLKLNTEGTEEGHAVTKGYVDGRVDEVAAALPNNAPQPVDIGSQILKVTGSRPTGAAGEPGNMLCWKAQTGGPGSPFNEIKFIVPDISVIDLNANEIWLKQGEVVQRWDTAGGGWFTNSNVLHISGTSTSGDDLIDGQPVELYYSDPTLPYLEVISREESKADDRKLQAEIEELALGVASLGRRFKYSLGSLPSDGHFLVNGSEVLFSFVDLSGVCRKMTSGPDFGWTNKTRMTVWNADGELWFAAELTVASNWSSTALRLYKDSVKLDRGLVDGEEYDVTVEGYW